MAHQTNLVRTIKNPFDKYLNQLHCLKSRERELNEKLKKPGDLNKNQIALLKLLIEDVGKCRKAM